MESEKSQELQSAGWKIKKDEDANFSLKTKPEAPNRLMFQFTQKARKKKMFTSTQTKGFFSYSVLFVFTWLDEVDTHQGEEPTLLHALIQMLIVTRKTLTDTVRMMFSQTTKYSLV
jgi:hypothetical protein